MSGSRGVVSLVGWALLATVLGAWPRTAAAAVVFENPGNLQGWDRQFTQHQGKVEMVTDPVYKGTTALKMTQIFEGTGNGRYHSEVETYHAAKIGDDHYFGQAMYIPKEWVFHDQNVCIQQWAPDNDAGPWIIMNLNGSHLHWLDGGLGTPDIGDLTALRGTWIRLVTRIKLGAGGAIEVWVNGNKTYSQMGNFNPSGGTIRWSTGLYATRWINQQPTGGSTLYLFHDHLRVATTYEEADPANWEESDTPGTDGGASLMADAGGAPVGPTPDAGVTDGEMAGGAGGAKEVGAGGAGGMPVSGDAGDGGGKMPVSGGAGNGGGNQPTGGDKGAPSASPRSSGCDLGGRPAGALGLLTLLGLWLAAGGRAATVGRSTGPRSARPGQ
jgi:hypothetical protein